MYNIIAPTGGFGNHLRTLMLLSKEFNLDNKSTDEKVLFFKEKLYCTDRSWQNWLDIEWSYRTTFDSILLFSHDIKNVMNKHKSIVLVSSPDLCLRCYIKFNSNLNVKTFDEFKNEVDQYNKLASNMLSKYSNIEVVNSDTMFNEHLDETLYNKCITFLNVENCYDTAKELHTIWYNLHRKAEKDFVDFFTKLYTL